MSKHWNPGKKSVELRPVARPSRIRRDPAHPIDKQPSMLGRIEWHSREWEIGLALVGITLFALGITALVFDLGEVLSH